MSEHDPASETLWRQLNVRVTPTLADRVAETARRLALHPSALLRLILAEHLPEYERRGRAAG